MGRKRSKSDLPTKICPVCERPFTWRKKWEDCWDPSPGARNGKIAGTKLNTAQNVAAVGVLGLKMKLSKTNTTETQIAQGIYEVTGAAKINYSWGGW